MNERLARLSVVHSFFLETKRGDTIMSKSRTTAAAPKSFNRHSPSCEEQAFREQALRSDDAFVLAMARAVRRGKERAVPGTFKDTTPPINARRIRQAAAVSACGSPAALCAE